MKLMNRKTLNDVFPDWATGGGIFSVLQTFPVPWQDETIGESDLSASLDLEYHGNVSGDKLCSPLINKFMSGEILTDAEKQVIATAIIAVCGVNWGEMWETLSYEYDPIENYSMTETMLDDETVIEYGKTHTRTDNLNHAKTGTETQTPNTTDTRTPNTTDTETPNTTETHTPNTTTETDRGVYGFNSVTDIPADTQTQTQTGTNTTTRTGTNTITHTGTDTLTRTGQDTLTYNTNDVDTGTQTDADTGSDTHTRNYTLTRSGNIGVTTSQMMIESQRNLWLWNFFRNVVFPDLDRVLTLRIY